jgi:hypothetical protein
MRRHLRITLIAIAAPAFIALVPVAGHASAASLGIQPTPPCRIYSTGAIQTGSTGAVSPISNRFCLPPVPGGLKVL